MKKYSILLTNNSTHPITQVTETLFPVITNEKLNAYLKEVASFLGIKKNLTFHMVRHTFTTTITIIQWSTY